MFPFGITYREIKFLEKAIDYKIETQLENLARKKAMFVTSLCFKYAVEESQKKSENLSGLKKLYCKLEENLANKWYQTSLKHVKESLDNPGLERELTLHFLDTLSKDKNPHIPVEILKKMNELPRINLEDEKKT